MIKYLGEMEEEDLIMFVLEHLKDHKGPQKLIEGLEPVRLLVLCILEKCADLSFSFTGLGRGSDRTRSQCMAADHIRKYGLQRRITYGQDACRLTLRMRRGGWG